MSAMSLVLAVCALGVAIIVAVAVNEWRMWRRARQPKHEFVNYPTSNSPTTATAVGPWTCTSCGGEVPNPLPAGPGLTRCQCGAASWVSAYKFPVGVTQPVTFDWNWPAA